MKMRATESIGGERHTFDRLLTYEYPVVAPCGGTQIRTFAVEKHPWPRLQPGT